MEEEFSIDSQGRGLLSKGKYRGEYVEDVPTWYLRWIVDEWDMEDENYNLAEKELRKR